MVYKTEFSFIRTLLGQLASKLARQKEILSAVLHYTRRKVVEILVRNFFNFSLFRVFAGK